MSNELSDLNIEAVQGLVKAINDTYTYANNSLFGALIPKYYKDYYYRYIKLACSWLDGYVPSLHSQTGIISTRIGSQLIKGFTRQIVGERPIFRKAENNSNADKSLTFISKWAEDNNIKNALFAGIGYAMAVGTSSLKLNQRVDASLWLEAVRFDNFFYKGTPNNVEEYMCMLAPYVNTIPNGENKLSKQYILSEHRYYKTEETGTIKIGENGFEPKAKKGEVYPVVEYEVYEAEGSVYNNLNQTQSYSTSRRNWEEIPLEVRNMIKNEYGAIRIGEPRRLPFTDLGVFILKNGECDISIPTGSQFGDSMLIGIQDDMITYEIASSYLLRDMYLGKGTVYMPKSLNINDLNPETSMQNGSPLMGVGETKVEIMKGVSADEQKIIVEQFQIRGEEYQLIKENCLRNIACKWGMSPKVIASYLSTPQQTATQIDSEDDQSIAFIYHTRSCFKNSLNKMVETVLNTAGLPGNVKIDFGTPSLINKDSLLNRVGNELQQGLIDLEEAIRTLNPDLDEESLQTKIETAKKTREEMMLQAQTEFNEEGSFNE